MVVDVGIVARPRVELAGESDLGVVFRQMRLHVQVGKFAHQRAGHLHLLGRRGDGEARRDRVDAGGPCRAIRRSAPWCRHSPICGVSSTPSGALRSIITLPAMLSMLRLMRLGEEGFGRLLVHRAIGGDRRRAVADHLVEEQPRDAAAVLGVAELRLFREGVVVQPVEQFGAVGGDDLHLREMHMRVDEAGQDADAAGGRCVSTPSPAFAATSA